jgi:hypothetical protein
MNRAKLLLSALSVVAVSACAGPMYYQGPMSAAYEVPPKATQAVGTVVSIYYPTTKALTWTVTYSGLSGPATAAHVHGPAAPGANAPVVIPATVSASPITGGATLTDAQAADLTAGLYYFNIHTAANPGGEMRGQMLPAK